MKRTEEIAFTAQARVLFVSDVHLSETADAERDRFVAFLDRCDSNNCTALFLHGDLFEFYVGARQGRQRFFAPLFEALARLVQRGSQVFVQRGNRDYLLGREFGRVGAVVLPDHVVLLLGRRRAHLSHGDDLCIEDRSYQFWARGVLQSGPLKALTRLLPLSAAMALARRYRRHSAEKWIGREPPSRLHSILRGAQARIAAKPADYVIAGHVHELALTPLEGAGQPFVLATTGSWQQAPNALIFADGELRAEVFTDLGQPLRRS